MKKVLKYLFILSFCAYAVLLYSIIFGQYTVNGVKLKGFERILENIKNIYWYFICIPIIPSCLTFQMCYIFRKKSKIMIMCSFIPCLFALWIALHSAFFGARFLGDTLYYGFEGFQIGMMSAFVYYVLFFPLLPICFIFQIGYLIYKTKKRKLKEKEPV